MQTRIEKWKLYRNEIINSGFLIEKIESDVKKIQDWKTRINRIDHKILADIEVDTYISSLLSINKNDFTTQTNLEKILSYINENELAKIQKEIENLRMSIEKDEIVNDSGKISSKWLEADATLMKFKEIKNDITNVNISISEYDGKGKEKIDKLEMLDDESGILANVKNIGELQNINNGKWNGKWIYYGSLIFVLIAIATIFIIIVVREEMGRNI